MGYIYLRISPFLIFMASHRDILFDLLMLFVLSNFVRLMLSHYLDKVTDYDM